MKDKQTYAIIGAAMEIHRVLGHGFLERVYQEAMEHELVAQQIVYQREIEVAVIYKDKKLNCNYRADFICFGDIIVELKATENLTSKDEAQLLNYLKATGYKRGLLLNFGNESLQYKRVVNGYIEPTE